METGSSRPEEVDSATVRALVSKKKAAVRVPTKISSHRRRTVILARSGRSGGSPLSLMGQGGTHGGQSGNTRGIGT